MRDGRVLSSTVNQPETRAGGVTLHTEWAFFHAIWRYLEADDGNRTSRVYRQSPSKRDAAVRVYLTVCEMFFCPR